MRVCNATIDAPERLAFATKKKKQANTHTHNLYQKWELLTLKKNGCIFNAVIICLYYHLLVVTFSVDFVLRETDHTHRVSHVNAPTGVS